MENAAGDVPAGAVPELARVLQCVREHRADFEMRGVAHVAVFGSVARGEANAASDVDVLIEPKPDKRLTLLDLAALQRLLESILKSRVDLVTAGTLARSEFGRAMQEESVTAF